MKRVMALVLSMTMVVGVLTGCGSTTAAVETSSESEKLQIVTTISPMYDWIQTIVGEDSENVEVKMFVDNGVDLHSYQATAADIITISNSDMFVYVGGESDFWVEDVLASIDNETMQVINLVDVLGDAVKVEEVVEGMEETEHSHDHEAEEDHDHDHEATEEDHDHDHEAEEEHDHDHEAEEDHDHDHEEGEVDEHVWLSLRNAEVICMAIADALIALDGANAEVYEANVAAYVAQLQALDAEYEAVVDGATVNTILFGDRFPFRYLVDDYGLDYYAAFVGCSAETEASFETIAFLAQKVDELGLTKVLTIEGVTHKIAETVVATTETKDQEILTIDSMQSTSSSDVENGATYLSIMKDNLQVLAEALA